MYTATADARSIGVHLMGVPPLTPFWQRMGHDRLGVGVVYGTGLPGQTGRLSS